MKKIAQQSTDTDYLLVVNEAIESFLKPQKTISGHIHTQVKTSDELMDIGIKLSQEFKRSALRDITFK
jgi:hypothetical protein